MFDSLMKRDYPQETAGSLMPVKPRTMLEQLKDRRAGMNHKVSELDSAIAALESNPEIEKILTLLGKVF